MNSTYPPTKNFQPTIVHGSVRAFSTKKQEWMRFVELATHALERGDKAESEAMWLAALDKAQKANASSTYVGEILLSLAEIYYSDHRLQEALQTCNRALECLSQGLGVHNPRLASCWNLLATIHFAQGDYTASECDCKTALSIFERAMGPESSDTIIATYNLGMIYTAQRRFLHAERFYRLALKLRKRTSCVGLALSTIIENYAGMLERSDRTAEAGELRRLSTN